MLSVFQHSNLKKEYLFLHFIYILNNLIQKTKLKLILLIFKS
jgi:hypothetical protein